MPSRRFILCLLLSVLCSLFTGCLGPVYGLYQLTMEEDDSEQPNGIPVVVASTDARTYDSSSVPIYIDLSDSDGHLCDLAIQYNDDGAGFTNALTLLDPVTGLAPGPHTIHWNAAADLGTPDTKLNMVIEVKAFDGIDRSLASTAAPCIIGNNAPGVTVVDPVGEQNDNVVIDFTISDPAADTCSVVVEYGPTQTGPWTVCDSASVIPNPNPAVLTSDTGLSHALMWNTWNDVGGAYVDVWIQVTATDDGGAQGIETVTGPVTVNNNTHPGVSFLSSGTTIKDDYAVIPIPYRLFDAESDACGITLEYSIDGTTYSLCTEFPMLSSEGVSGLTSSPGGSDHLFHWNTFADVGGNDMLCDLRIRATDINGNDSVLAFKSIFLTNNSTSAPDDPAVYPAGNYVYSVAVGDVDGDGYDEIVTANSLDDMLTMYYGTAAGPGSQTTMAVGDNPGQMVIADFDNDGYGDIVCANQTSDNLSIIYGDGTGPILPAGTLAAGDYPYDLTTTDCNGDSVPDLICVNRYTDNFTFYYGGPLNGPFTLAAGDSPFNCEAGDINGDGYGDFASSNEAGDTVTIWLGNIWLTHTVATGAGPYDLTIADVNGDGFDDIITCNRSADNMTFIAGKASGPYTGTTVGAGNYPWTITSGDLNGDGFADFACGNAFDDSLTVVLGSASGPGSPVTRTAGEEPIAMSSGDVNGDGYADFICACRNSDSICLLMGNPETIQTPITYVAGDYPASAATGDINGDGIDDFVVGNRNSDDVTLILGNGPGLQSFEYASTGDYPLDIAVGDINGDGLEDLISANTNGDNLTCVFGGVRGVSGSVTVNGGNGPSAVTSGDYNGDGFDDFASVADIGSEMVLHFGSAAGPVDETPLTCGTGPIDAASGDFNSDGFMDLAAANGGSNNVTVYLGASGTTLSGPATLATGTWPSALCIADLNGDGYQDLVCANRGAHPDYFGTVSVMLGSGSGLSFIGNVSTGDKPMRLATGDFNGDGLADVVSSNEDGYNVSVLWGSTGAFSVSTYAAGTDPWDVTAGDYNGDGYDDIACANSGNDTVTIRLGGPSGPVDALAYTLTVPDFPCRLDSSDFNADGYTDIAGAAWNADSIFLLMGMTKGPQGGPIVNADIQPRAIACANVNGGYTDAICWVSQDLDRFTIAYHESLNRGKHDTINTSAVPCDLTVTGASMNFPVGTLTADTDVTLWLSGTPVKLPHLDTLGTLWRQPIPVSPPWEVMPYNTAIGGTGTFLTLSFYPNVSTARLTGKDFRLYRYHWGTDKLDPSDDVYELVGTTENATLTVEPTGRTAVNTSGITEGGRFQLFQVTP